MTDLEQLRLVEVKFYYLIKGLFKLTPDVEVILSLNEMLARYNNYNILTMQSIILNYLDQIQLKPNEVEAVILLYKARCSTRDICKTVGISNNKLYRILYNYEHDPFVINIKDSELRILEMEKFIKAYEKLCSLGGFL